MASENVEDWARVVEARQSGTIQPAIAHVEHTLRTNRGYLGALGDEQLAAMVVQSLVCDGWTLTPPAGGR